MFENYNFTKFAPEFFPLIQIIKNSFSPKPPTLNGNLSTLKLASHINPPHELDSPASVT